MLEEPPNADAAAIAMLEQPRKRLRRSLGEPAARAAPQPRGSPKGEAKGTGHAKGKAKAKATAKRDKAEPSCSVLRNAPVYLPVSACFASSQVAA